MDMLISECDNWLNKINDFNVRAEMLQSEYKRFKTQVGDLEKWLNKISTTNGLLSKERKLLLKEKKRLLKEIEELEG